MRIIPKYYSEQSKMTAGYLTSSNKIILDYHYRIIDYLILFFGGTRVPVAIDVYDKKTHRHMLHIENKEVLDLMADD